MMKKVEKQIEAFLTRAEVMRTEMQRSDPGLLVVDQINVSLIFVSPKKSYIYEMDYVDNFVNRSEGVPEGQFVWHDEYVLKIVKECRRDENPELFLEILKRSMRSAPAKAYEIFVDGKQLRRTTTFNKAKKYVAWLKGIIKNPVDEAYKSLRYAKRISIVDPSGNTTWFILDPAAGHYDASYKR